MHPRPPEHLKHELLFKKKREGLGKKRPLKRTASGGSPDSYLLRAISEDRDADFCGAPSLSPSLAAAHVLVPFNFCTDTGEGVGLGWVGGGLEGGTQVWIPYFFFLIIFIYLFFIFFIFFWSHINSPLRSCNKHERPLCCHFTLVIEYVPFDGWDKETTKRCDRSFADNCGFVRVTPSVQRR